MIALDFESSGLDLFHGAHPFAVTWCDEQGPKVREWSVDPVSRKVDVPSEDLERLRQFVGKANRIVCHNSKFDFRCLEVLGIDPPWHKVEDTLVASHVLFSAPPHNLTWLAKVYLDTNIKPFEDALEQAVKKCRSVVSQARLKEKRFLAKNSSTGGELSEYRHWAITEEGDEDLPSAKGATGLWHNDYFFPKCLYNADPTNPDYKGFDTILRNYAACDSAITYRLWQHLERLLHERSQWKIYRARLEAVPAAFRMERRGMSLRAEVIRQKTEDYSEQVEETRAVIEAVARKKNYPLVIPKGNTNHSIDDFVFGRADKSTGKRNPKSRIHAPDTLNLPVVKETESGNPSFDYDAREHWLGLLPQGSIERLFVESLNRHADYEKALQALRDYDRFKVLTEYGYRIHPWFNNVGTQTTRLSSQNPNAQNVSSQSVANLRACFGPAPGRVCYSMDATNIELRIPAYLAGERELIDVFERPNDPPYYGSYHLVIFDTIRPQQFAKWGKKVKDDTNECYQDYKCVKNGNFARQYGAQQPKVDATYRVPGAYDKIAKRFPKIDKLNRETIQRANATGCVVTVPDKEVDPDHGYRIVCRRNSYDNISPTIPFAYFVSGTAGWWMGRSIVKCDRLLEVWRQDENYDGHMIASVHDELLFDVPAQGLELEMVRMRQLRDAMESCGEDGIGIKTPVEIDRHVESWAIGEKVK